MHSYTSSADPRPSIAFNVNDFEKKDKSFARVITVLKDLGHADVAMSLFELLQETMNSLMQNKVIGPWSYDATLCAICEEIKKEEKNSNKNSIKTLLTKAEKIWAESEEKNHINPLYLINSMMNIYLASKIPQAGIKLFEKYQDKIGINLTIQMIYVSSLIAAEELEKASEYIHNFIEHLKDNDRVIPIFIKNTFIHLISIYAKNKQLNKAFFLAEKAGEYGLIKNAKLNFYNIDPYASMRKPPPIGDFKNADSIKFANEILDYFQKFKFANAKESCLKLIAAEPNHPWPYIQLGWILVFDRSSNETIIAHEKAITAINKNETFDRNRELAELYLSLGIAYVNNYFKSKLTSDMEKANDCYQTVLELDPSNIKLYHYWGIWLKQLKKYDEAITRFAIASQIYPNDADVCFHLGDCYKELQIYERAEHYYKQALERATESNNLELVSLSKERHALLAQSNQREKIESKGTPIASASQAGLYSPAVPITVNTASQPSSHLSSTPKKS